MGQAVLALFFHGHDLHRDVPRGGVQLELVEHRPAQHVGQEDIQRDGRRVILPRQRQRRRALGGDDALEADVARQPQQDAREVRVVFDDQQRQVAREDGFAVVGNVLFAHHRQDRALGQRLGGGTFYRACRLAPAGRGAGIVQRQVQREHAALAVHAGQFDLAPQQHRQFAADGQAQAGAPVLACGAGVGLLEGLEDQPLLVGRHANAGVFHREGHHLLRLGQHRVVNGPALLGHLDTDVHVALRGEFHRVGQQVLQDLLQALRVAGQRARQVLREADLEGQVLRFGHMAEVAVDVLAQPGEGDVFDLDRHRARFDLRQVENVVDQVQQVRARRVDVARELDLLRAQRAGCVLGQLLTQDQNRIQRRAQLVRHVGQEFRLVLRRQRQFGRLLFQRATRLLHLGVLALDFGVLFGQQPRLGAQLFVGLLQFALPRLQFHRQLLRLRQQALGAHRRLDGVEHRADALRQQVQEGQ